ncbi:MAG: CsgG/HfaB family protein [Candidatus Lustribacter sp.]|jgi:curli biogenesis system outer membrane secretion channel CsgG
MKRMLFLLALGTALTYASIATGPARAAGPTTAVLDFDTKGLTSDWWGAFEPGVAISDLVTDQLVNGGKFTMVDRTHLDQTLAEHQLSAAGEVSPATAIQSGQLIGARYLVTGNVLQFAQTSQSGASVGGFLGGLAGAAVGSVSTQRVTLQVAVRVVDAATGQILQTFTDEQSKSGTSWGTGAFSGYVGGSYSNQQFLSSTMGQLINSVAIDIANKLDPAKFSSAPAGPSLTGKVIAADGKSLIINLGSTEGVAVGMYFDVMTVRQIRDADSGKVLTSHQTTGKMQIVSVDTDTAVGQTVNGTGAVGATVQSGP